MTLYSFIHDMTFATRKRIPEMKVEYIALENICNE